MGLFSQQTKKIKYNYIALTWHLSLILIYRLLPICLRLLLLLCPIKAKKKPNNIQTLP